MTDGRTGPLSLRISVTDRCQMRCIYCMPAGGLAWVAPDSALSYEEMACFVKTAARHFGVMKVHITGGEPLLRADVATLVSMLADTGVSDIALTTNGQLLAAAAAPLARAGLTRVNVSLDTLDARTFRALTRGGDIAPVLEGIDAAMAEAFACIKINTLVLRCVNDAEVVTLAKWALAKGLQSRFLELMPIGPAAKMHSALFVPADEVVRRLGSFFRLAPVGGPGHGTGVRYAATGADGVRGTIGLVPSQSRPFCHDCRRLRLTADGRLVGCLGLGTGESIRNLLAKGAGGEDRLVRAIGEALRVKRKIGEFSTVHYMSQTGG